MISHAQGATSPRNNVRNQGLITTTLMATFYFAERHRSKRAVPAAEPEPGA